MSAGFNTWLMLGDARRNSTTNECFNQGLVSQSHTGTHLLLTAFITSPLYGPAPAAVAFSIDIIAADVFRGLDAAAGRGAVEASDGGISLEALDGTGEPGGDAISIAADGSGSGS